MDLNDQIILPVQKLEEMCAVCVATQIVTSCITEVDTCIAITLLPLPRLIKRNLKSLVSALVKQYEFWRERLQFQRYRPSWTSYGVLDTVKSIEGFLEDEAMDLGLRNIVARMYCHEKYVFKLAKKLKNDDSRISDFFPRAIVCRDRAMEEMNVLCMIWEGIIETRNWFVGFGQLRQLRELYALGLEHALIARNEAAYKYFLGKVSSNAVRRYQVNPELWSISVPFFSFSPAAILLHFSKLSQTAKEHLRGFFSMGLLRSFMKWPHQHLFEAFAPTLVNNLSDQEYLKVLEGSVSDADVYLSDVAVHFVDVLWGVGATQRSGLQGSAVLGELSETIQGLKNRVSVDGHDLSADALFRCVKGCCCKMIPQCSNLFITLEAFRKHYEETSILPLDNNVYRRNVYSLMLNCISDECCAYLLTMRNALRTGNFFIEG